MNKDIYSRVIGLIGEESFSNITNKKIYLAGLGGVGGTTFIALVRSGFMNFTIIDMDVVNISNLNRQLLYTYNDIDKYKAEVAHQYALNINNEIVVNSYSKDVREVLPSEDTDFIVDCIDDINAKILLIKYAREHNIPIISSMGCANKFDPSKLKLAPLNKTTVDPLARKLRYELKKAGVDFSNLMTVYSDETPIKDGSKLNSLVTVTSTAGLYIANYIFQTLKNK